MIRIYDLQGAIEKVYILLKSSKTDIISNSFQNSYFSQIALPPTVTEIGDYSFTESTNLRGISIPSSVKKIGDYAFSGCSMLKEIIIPPSVTSIGDYAFAGCSMLRKIIIPPSVTSIGDYAFAGCSMLRKIIIPPSVTSIGDYAFAGCHSLKKIIFSPSIESIGNYAFANCYSLQYVTKPKSFKSLSKRTYSKCKLFTEYNNESQVYRGDFHIIGLLSFFATFLFLTAWIIAVFIISIVWWSRIHPWFAHGYKSGKKVYVSLMLCWISSIFGIVLLLLYFLIYFIIHKFSLYIIILKKHDFFEKLRLSLNISAFIMINLLFLIAIISSMIASSYAYKKEKIDGESIKCLGYVFNGYQGASDWVVNQSSTRQNDLNIWYSNMIKKAFKKDGKVSNYYCKEVGASLTFAILSLLFWILNIIAYCLTGCYFYIPGINSGYDIIDDP